MTDIIEPALTASLEEERLALDSSMRGLIANPYRGDYFIQEMRIHIVQVAKVLMVHNIPLAKTKGERTLVDVLQEAVAETAMMMGSDVVAKGVGFVSKVKSDIKKARADRPADAEEIEIFEDEDTGDLFYYDKDENEVLCDEDGFSLEEDTQEDDANE